MSKGDSKKKRKKAKENFELMKKLIRTCFENWDNQIKKELREQKEALETL